MNHINSVLLDIDQVLVGTSSRAGIGREASGEDVTELLAIAPLRFHQHIRSGQQKLLNALFE